MNIWSLKSHKDVFKAISWSTSVFMLNIASCKRSYQYLSFFYIKTEIYNFLCASPLNAFIGISHQFYSDPTHFF